MAFSTSRPALSVAVGGRRWRNGFTAELRVTNTGLEDLTGWSLSFVSPHLITGTPWGVTLARVELAGGLMRYTLTGSGWAAALKAGASVTVGFSGRQGVAIGDGGDLNAELLLAPGAPEPLASPLPAPAPSPPLRVEVGGSRWWNGFTAELRITNSSGRDLTSWSHSFTTPHRINGAPWGATLASEELAGGLMRYTLTGSGWAAALKAGASVTVGFSGRQGVAIGHAGALTAEQLFTPVAAPPPNPPSEPPAPEPPVSGG
ncbi:MAG: cellulose binding domain-containing protein, partial [Cyanobacteriota bacterium]|nr:cellulose binding domain-containing protein [Cyanobacteriota bacterium]